MKTINSFSSKLLALTLALMASVSSFAYEFEYSNDFHIDGFAYKVLPSNTLWPYGAVALIEIADCAADVIIPDTITYTFSNTTVTYIVTTLGGGAALFTNSAKETVKSISIPKGISVINSPLFAGCSNLTSIVVDSENPYYDSRENCNAIITTSQNPYFTPNTLIAGCKTTIIPNSVAEIGDNAFYNSALESITIPTGTTKIGRSAFNNSILLSSITLSATLIEISDWAFADCLSLNTIICYAIEPPTISSNTFFGSNPIYNNPTIYVPAESVEAYKNADQWKDFGQILPIEPTTDYKSQWCNEWNVMFSNGSVYPPSNMPYRYQLAKDTVIGERTYTAVVQKEINDALDAPRYVAAVRFTDDRKVYIYYDNAEYLLYDFNVQEGDELEVFAGINNYRFGIKTYKCIVTGVEQYACIGCPATITLHVPNHPDDFTEIYRRTQWQEGVGDVYSGFLNGVNGYVPVDGGGSVHLLCAYQGDELKYTGPLYEEYGCGDNAEQSPEDLFPTLWGLQRTVCNEYCGDTEDDNSDNITYKQTFTSISFENNKPYILCRGYLLREESNKILLYSESLNKEIVLYDFTLEVGDSLPAYIEHFDETIYPADTLVVTDVSYVTLLDGKEYKKWTFNNGMEYVEGIGMYGGYRNGNFVGLIQELVVPCHTGTHLVCVSKNGKLLYQMDEAEMERLGAECLCEVETSYKSQWCDTWNVMWFDGMRFDETASTSQYRLGKDTIIGDYVYSKFTSRTSIRFTDDRKVYVYHEYFDDHDPYSEDLPTGEYLAYDFSAQVGDTLEVFSGIGTYSTYPCVVDDVQIDSETNLRTMTLHKICRTDEYEYDDQEMTWIEGVGSPQGFLISYRPCGWVGGGTYALLCAYQDDELKYTGSFYERFGCDYKAGVVSNDLFPTLSGLQRTICREYCEQADNKTRIEQFTNLTTRTETGGPYLYYSPFLLREKDNKILIYSRTLNKDLVLYDFNLQVGDSLPMLYIDFFAKDDWIPDSDMKIWCVVDYHKDLEGNILPADTLIVTDVSAITLLDGKEYKKWTFNNGMEYVEGIGSFGNRQWSGDFFQLIGNMDIPVSLHGEHLVCASRNGKLLYQMDDTEMERLGAECLCEAETPEDLFPTLWGLQRTTFYHYTECSDSYSSLTASNEIVTINDKPYLRFGKMFLREENNQVLIYSAAYDKDLVLYDWNLEVGDSISLLAMDYGVYPEYAVSVVDYRVIVDIDENGDLITDTIPTDKVVVDKISTITLLDGKEYKTWHLATGWAGGITYVEGIGILSEGYGGGDYLGLIRPEELPTCYYGDLLVCVSKNNKLLYQMDPVKMDELGTECLCDYDRGPRKDNAKNGKIGGRPTPTQWNMLEVETKEMDGTPTILRAETFSYTLENDSIVTNGKTFYQLARQSTKDTAITKSFVGALHFGKEEDNRVYFLRDGVEYVLYDFTAEPGDTIEIFAGINNYPQETTYTHVVVDKDTTEDGACRMFLEVVFPDETTTATNAEKVWLAGLGSIDGIVHNAAQRTSDVHAAPAKSASSETQSSVMLCAWREDSCLYTTNHPEYDTFGCVYNQDPTAVENLTSPSSYQKILHEGKLLILHNGKIYNVLGVSVK